MTYGSLFSGIGGLDLALEAFGHTPIWQAESDPYARAVLAKHWPEVRRYNDVREIDHEAPPADIICGGFPCQDISNAGKRVGIDGERSGLWSEFARIIRVLRPRFVFVENVAALTVRGLDRVLGDLASLGFDAEWDVLRAADVGAPHLRARIFLLAHARQGGLRPGILDLCPWQPDADGGGEDVADSIGYLVKPWRTGDADEGPRRRDADRGVVAANVSDANGGRFAGKRGTKRERSEAGIEDVRGNVADGCDRAAELAHASSEGWGPEAGDAEAGPSGAPPSGGEVESGRRSRGLQRWGYWNAEPNVGRVVARIPTGVDGRGSGIGKGSRGIGGGRDRANRLRCLGNAVVWQQAAFALETLTARARRAASTEAA